MSKRSDTGPFSIVPEWLLDHAEVTATEVYLYAVLGRYADKEGAAWPSRSTLAERMGCSVKTVDRAIANLVEYGALEVQHQKMRDKKAYSSNLYRVIRADPTGLGSPVDVARGRDTGVARGRDTSVHLTRTIENENHLNESHAEEEERSLAPLATRNVPSAGRGERLKDHWLHFLSQLSSRAPALLSPVQDPGAYASTSAQSGGEPPWGLDLDLLFLSADAIRWGLGREHVILPQMDDLRDFCAQFGKWRELMGEDFEPWLEWAASQVKIVGSMRDDRQLLMCFTQASTFKGLGLQEFREAGAAAPAS